MKITIQKLNIFHTSPKLYPVEVVTAGAIGSQVLRYRITETDAGFIVTDAPNDGSHKAIFTKPFKSLHDAGEAIRVLILGV